jgi:phospholipid/cholesterol/gamma-HCH transport system permease protein
MPIETIENTAKQLVLTVQDYSLFAARAFMNLWTEPRYWPEFLVQSDIVGFGSAAIVLLSGFFTGGVLALQSAATLSQFGATAVTGQFVSITMIRELGPVLTGIMVAGRNASSMASELGSMVVTEQIDAMRALGTDPIQKLVTPRMIATCVMLPMLTIVADFVGLIGGYVIAYFQIGLTTSQYWTNAYQALEYNDVVQGLLKPFVFAFIISLVGCFYGLRTTGGTQGVGLATTKAVVAASVWVFVVTSLLTRIFVNLH